MPVLEMNTEPGGIINLVPSLEEDRREVWTLCIRLWTPLAAKHNPHKND